MVDIARNRFAARLSVVIQKTLTPSEKRCGCESKLWPGAAIDPPIGEGSFLVE